MSIFKNNYYKPGPGVPKDAPRKRGFPRFFEVLSRDFANLVKLNLILFICMLPGQVAFAVALLFLYSAGYVTLWFFLLLALGAALSFLVGPAATAASGLVAHMLRDEPGFLWHDFKKMFKENFRGTVLPGVIFSLFVAAELAAVVLQMRADSGFSPVAAGISFLSIFVFAMSVPYFFVQSAFLELGTFGKLKNSILLALGNLPRSAAGGILGAGITAALYLLLPLSFPILLFIGYTVPLLAQLMFIWPPIDKAFKIDATLLARRKAEAEAGDKADEVSSALLPPEEREAPAE